MNMRGMFSFCFPADDGDEQQEERQETESVNASHSRKERRGKTKTVCLFWGRLFKKKKRIRLQVTKSNIFQGVHSAVGSDTDRLSLLQSFFVLKKKAFLILQVCPFFTTFIWM